MPETSKNIYFQVSNFEENRSNESINNEVLLKYLVNITIPENANLPLEYKLYRIIDGTESEVTLTEGKSEWINVATENEVHEYKLYIKGKNGENDISYQNLTDNIKISVELEQLD